MDKNIPWIKTLDLLPNEHQDGEQVFTLPVTLNGAADFTWTHHVIDDPYRYPSWLGVSDVIALLSGNI